MEASTLALRLHAALMSEAKTEVQKKEYSGGDPEKVLDRHFEEIRCCRQELKGWNFSKARLGKEGGEPNELETGRKPQSDELETRRESQPKSAVGLLPWSGSADSLARKLPGYTSLQRAQAYLTRATARESCGDYFAAERLYLRLLRALTSSKSSVTSDGLRLSGLLGLGSSCVRRGRYLEDWNTHAAAFGGQSRLPDDRCEFGRKHSVAPILMWRRT
jgi:hypothetical protein